MNKFAEIKYGKIANIYNTTRTFDEFIALFTPTTLIIDVTNMECNVGDRVDFKSETEFNIIPPPVILPKTLEELKQIKLNDVLNWTSILITDGFSSNASGETKYYDSKLEDQNSYYVAYMATQSPDFEEHQVYKGYVPVRCRLVKETPFNEKIIIQLNKEQFQKLIDDLALHVATCKAKGWELQEKVNNAQTEEELNSINFDILKIKK